MHYLPQHAARHVILQLSPILLLSVPNTVHVVRLFVTGQAL